MKKYEYVRVKGDVKALASTITFDGHREIIDEYAAKGWRYAGFIPVSMQVTGYIKEMDLVFEKE